MKRRNFIRTSAAVASVTVAGSVLAASQSPANQKEIYEMRVYYFKNGGGKTAVDNFYKESLIPFMNKNGAKVGAFGEYGLTEPPVVYYVIVYPSIADYQRIKNDLWKDETFMKSAKLYFDKTAELGTYIRFETYLLEAFDGIPKFRQPGNDRGLFELRIYESNNEEAGQRKIKMFNSEEIALFDKIELQAFLFGEILAGPQMPALVYFLWFTNMEQREAKWKLFRDSPEWNVMRVKPEYANSVSRVNKKFLIPLDYSQI